MFIAGEGGGGSGFLQHSSSYKVLCETRQDKMNDSCTEYGE